MISSVARLFTPALFVGILMIVPSPAFAQGVLVGFDVNFQDIGVGNDEGQFVPGKRIFSAPGAVLGFTFGGEESEDFGVSADFRMQLRSTRIELQDGRTTTFREGFMSDFTLGEGVMVRVKNAAGGFFLDQRILGRGDSFVDLGSIAFGNMLVGMGFAGKVNVGSTRLTQVQFQWINYYWGDMMHGDEGVPLQDGREWRLTGAYMFRPRMGLRGEYSDSRMRFEQRLFNLNGAFDHKSTNLSLGVVFILF